MLIRKLKEILIREKVGTKGSFKYYKRNKGKEEFKFTSEPKLIRLLIKVSEWLD